MPELLLLYKYFEALLKKLFEASVWLDLNSKTPSVFENLHFHLKIYLRKTFEKRSFGLSASQRWLYWKIKILILSSLWVWEDSSSYNFSRGLEEAFLTSFKLLHQFQAIQKKQIKYFFYITDSPHHQKLSNYGVSYFQNWIFFLRKFWWDFIYSSKKKKSNFFVSWQKVFKIVAKILTW